MSPYPATNYRHRHHEDTISTLIDSLIQTAYIPGDPRYYSIDGDYDSTSDHSDWGSDDDHYYDGFVDSKHSAEEKARRRIPIEKMADPKPAENGKDAAKSSRTRSIQGIPATHKGTTMHVTDLVVAPLQESKKGKNFGKKRRVKKGSNSGEKRVAATESALSSTIPTTARRRKNTRTNRQKGRFDKVA